MICYRDRTFCPFFTDCNKAENCPRPLTDEVKRKAREWWGADDPPIAIFADKPSCHDAAAIRGGDPI